MSLWDEIKSIFSARIEHILPIIVLIVIFAIFLVACLYATWKERNAEDLSQPPQSTEPNVVLTDGKTGEERVLDQE
ncbi:hypothetical protein GCK32_021157 [Trichostrongylus colubriformis]|uniref:Uncharacterized protein n=1 Tax=Trichostrongylus colubriformis TaxID=6319 RepID=A0AAN8FYS1_TRICO